MEKPDPTPGVSAELEKYEQEQYEDWLQVGIAAGWVSDVGCATHHGLPMRDWEEALVDNGDDPCFVVMRVWMDGMQHVTMADVIDDE